MADSRILTRGAQEVLKADDLTRLKFVRRRPFILHGAAKDIHLRLEEALEDFPTEGDAHILIVGDSGMGKSKLVKRFAALHGCPEDGSASAARIPVLYVSFAITASPKGFLGRILERLNAPYSSNASSEVLYPLVLRLLRRIGLKMLIVDEVHHVFSGAKDRRLEALAVLKLLGNDLGITIVACGIDTALRAIQIDPQMVRRFDPIPLNRWTVNDQSAGFLNSLEAHLPLAHASNLSEERILTWILTEAEGLTGEIVGIVRRAAVEAIKTQRERIDLQTLRSLDWIRLSARTKASEAALKIGSPR
ncbi:TniB family NTP-binding protein [Caulobacter sp.]|uniref:TniB family NTP-binding protein n=1 Tax=Caulobacter sp. TaxID=78 RepID=UPI003D0C7ABD